MTKPKPAHGRPEPILLRPDDKDVQLLLTGAVSRCPFCGGTPSTSTRFFEHSSIYQGHVNCSRCHATILYNSRDREEARDKAIERWSARPPTILAMSETLEAQAAEIAQMREALEPFANEAETWWVNVPDNARPWIAEPGNSGGADAEFTVGDLRRAHELYRALTATTPETKETD